MKMTSKETLEEIKWILVEDRLPKKNEGYKFLVTRKSSLDSYVDILSYGKLQFENKKAFYFYDGEYGDVEVNDVIAWMPLPAPYVPSVSHIKTQGENKMTSKEAIKLAKIEFEKDFEDGEETNQWLKDVIKGLDKAEKDLEVLEIFKQVFKMYKSGYYGLEIENDEQREKIKEWLENE